MERLYHQLITHHLKHYPQMVFLSGPRQVGKTTLAKECFHDFKYTSYLNWDRQSDRERILAGETKIVAGLPIDAVLPQKPLIVFDELHKYKNWKSLLKGFIDEYKDILHIIVTGSAKLDIYRRGGDSLMGRYFLYRIHPFSVNELLHNKPSSDGLSPPMLLPDEEFNALFEFGGFPEPLFSQNKSFYNRWQRLRQQQMFREDIRELAQIHELAQLEVLASLLQQQAGQLTNYTELAKKVRVHDTTIRRWIQVLESFYYCFSIRPWSNNVGRSLLKEPKIYLWDWSTIHDKGARVENFVASHLLKAVHFWTDSGLGEFDLYFLRDKDQREVDFLICKDKKPWLMLEVKTSAKEPLSPHLRHFRAQIKPEHVLQAAFDLPFVKQDCFQLKTPHIVSLRAFLSQLV